MPKKPPAVTCAENIALLEALHTVPKPPWKTERPSPASAAWPGDYRLSFDQERLIASAFAFLSSISDNPNNVTAVCIQEDHDGRQGSLRLLLAKNRQSHGDGQTVLETVKTGLETVVEPLKRLDNSVREGSESVPSRLSIEDDTLTAIVRMCEKRILCRLRLIPTSRGETKQPLKKSLQQAIESLRRTGRRTISNLAPMVENMRSVMKLLDAWTQYRALARLRDLVKGVHRLNELAGLHSAIRSIPNDGMEQQSRESLVNTIQKVARYIHIARLLYHMAKDTTPMLRRTCVVIVDLPTAAYAPVQPNDDHTSNIVAKINEVSQGTAYSKRDMDVLFRYLDTDREAASRKFEKQTRKTLAEAKVHAEIQLAAYCSSSPIQQFLPPRVVRSNKDACFLCSTFLQAHSNMYTSRHHGKLYPGWRLPQTFSASVQKSFNVELANIIQKSIETLKNRRTKSKYRDPIESTVTSLPSLRSRISLVSLSTPLQSECTSNEETCFDGVNKDGTADDKLDSVVAQGTTSTNAPQPPNDDRLRDDPLLERQYPQASSSTHLAADTSLTEIIPREPGLSSKTIPDTSPTTSTLPGKVKTVSGPPSLSLSGRVQHGQTPALLNFPPFEILFDYAKEVHATADKTTDLYFTLHQLIAEDVVKLQTEKVAVVDVEKLCFGEDVSCTLDSMDCLYISGKGSFLKISLGFPTAR